MHTPKYLLSLIGTCLLFIPLTAQAEYISWKTSQLKVNAALIELNPEDGIIEASGAVRLHVGPIELQCNRLQLSTELASIQIEPPFVILSDNFSIAGSAALIHPLGQSIEVLDLMATHTLQKGELKLKASKFTCDSGTCMLQQGQGTACPHSPAGYSIHAKKITLHDSGDITLNRPVFYFGNTPIAILPWIKLKQPDSLGFLAPRIAWDQHGGFIIGPRVYIPVKNRGYLTAHAAIRTSEGMESSLTFNGSNSALELHHLLEHRDNHLRVKINSLQQLNPALLVLDGDLTTDRRIIENLSFYPEERAITHTQNRARLAVDGQRGILETQLTYIQPFTISNEVNQGSLSPNLKLKYSFFPITSLKPIWPELELSFDRRFQAEIASPLANSPNVPNRIPAHSRFIGMPSISFPAKIGIFTSTTRLSSLHRIALADQNEPSTSTHLIGATTNISLPIVGYLGSIRHLISLGIGYRITPFALSDSQSWAVDDLDTVTSGHGVQFKISNSLGGSPLSPLFRLLFFERLFLPGIGDRPDGAYLHASTIFNKSFLFFDADLSWDHHQDAPSYVSLRIGAKDKHGTGVTTGGKYYGSGLGAHRDRWIDTNEPWSFPNGPYTIVNSVELVESFSAVIADFIHLNAGAKIGIHPDTSLHSLFYNLQFHSKCNCISLGVEASHRFDSAVPDVRAIFKLNNF